MTRLTLRKFAEGDKHALSLIYEECFTSVYSLAKAIFKDDSLAGDAVQEAFIKAHLYCKSYNFSKPFDIWLNKIVVNVCRDIITTKNKNIVVFDEQLVEKLETNDVYKMEEYELLYKALQTLEDKYRIPLILKYTNGYREVEISDILHLKKSTVKSRLYDGRVKIKGILKELGYGG